jgi:cyclin-dependent kinase 7
MEAIREMKLMAELRHPNVLRLLDIFSHHQNIVLTLEYMHGDMENLIKGRAAVQKSLSAGDVKAYMKMLLQGIEACHQNFIMHRDLKPGNLLISADGVIKIGLPPCTAG